MPCIANVQNELTEAHLEELAYWKEQAKDAGDGDPILRTADWQLCKLELARLAFPEKTRMDTDVARNIKIKEWVASKGGFDKAFKESPPVVIEDSRGRLDVVDGWHRLRLAYLACQTEAWVLKGALPCSF